MRKSILLLIFILTACSQTIQEKKNIKTINEFYKIYSERKELNKLIEFYSSDVKYIDAVPKILIEGKDNLKHNFTVSWTGEGYKAHPNYPHAITINEILANDSVIVVNGQYNPYYYNNNLFDEMKFTTWNYINKNGKIFRQIEWVQYPINELEQIIQAQKNIQIEIQ